MFSVDLDPQNHQNFYFIIDYKREIIGTVYRSIIALDM